MTKIFNLLFFPEPLGYVIEVVGSGFAVNALVCGAFFKASEMSDVGTEFYVIERISVYMMWEILLAAVPTHFESWVMMTYV